MKYAHKKNYKYSVVHSPIFSKKTLIVDIYDIVRKKRILFSKLSFH